MEGSHDEYDGRRNDDMGHGTLCLLVILVLILGAAALLKYLFSGKSQHLNGGK
jgi:hypothetical protein